MGKYGIGTNQQVDKLNRFLGEREIRIHFESTAMLSDC